MERQAKLDLVIKSIEEAKKITPKGQPVKVYFPSVLKYKEFRLEELKDILTILEDDEKILTLERFPRYLLDDPDWYSYIYHDSSGKTIDPLQEYFIIKVRRSFNEWCANYWKLPIKLTKNDAIRQVWEALSFEPAQPQGQVDRIAVLSEQQTKLREQKGKDLPEDEINYYITFTKGREILLNDSYQIARPDFERENEQVFGYLYNHPNEKFTKKQLEEELRTNLLKSFHKIVENLGFTGVLRKAFFSVSKDSIQFRNPIASKDVASSVMEELKSLIAKA